MATQPIKDPKARVVNPSYDQRGVPHWTMRLSPPDDTFAMCLMVPDRVIPVIFVPGVMGSNLIEKGRDADKAMTWLLDDTLTAARWTLIDRGAETRKRYLHPQVMEVNENGAIPQGTAMPDEELRRRGWGEVGALSYGPWLVWLENALNDFEDPQAGERVKLTRESLRAELGEALLQRDEVGLSYKYRFPVHACGYNWLDSNAASAKRLGQRIGAIIERYTKEGNRCEKVIIVTHSMGGLVARHCSEVGGFSDKILGIVHGVMPAIGAAVVYRRFKSGTENFNKGFVKSAKGTGTSMALGQNAAEMTAVLSTAPGPLQLLPTPEYGNGWLKIQDGNTERSLPENGDPYGEIYTVPDKWWSMAEKHLINPLNTAQDSKKRQAQIEADWLAFAEIIRQEVKRFHDDITSRYHPNTHAFIGNGAAVNSVGNVRWERFGSGRVPTDAYDARAANPAEINEVRSVMVKAPGSDVELKRHFRLAGPDETGDGTVPARSGLAVRPHTKAFMQVSVEHEPAFKHSDGPDNLLACRFTLRAIVQIAQAVQQTSLKYD